jgi:hypothetical protein
MSGISKNTKTLEATWGMVAWNVYKQEHKNAVRGDAKVEKHVRLLAEVSGAVDALCGYARVNRGLRLSEKFAETIVLAATRDGSEFSSAVREGFYEVRNAYVLTSSGDDEVRRNAKNPYYSLS